jgi:autotransporter-associated beta strand protein
LDGGAAIGGNLVKTGLGKLTLTGMNTYTGATTVSGGTFVNGSIASSPLTTVNAGAALGGNGRSGWFPNQRSETSEAIGGKKARTTMRRQLRR